MLLKGVKVLDMSNLLPGPMCSLFLADLGAEVIKIENLDGDPMRGLGSIKSQSPYFKSLNRNKKSMTLNLKTDYGKRIFMQLANDADVIIEGFRPGKIDSLGIGYKDVKKINPEVIYCSITGYGQSGPYRDKAGHDLNYAALSGLLELIARKPHVPGIQIADVGSSLIAAFSIVASLYYRKMSGKGNYIDVSVLCGTLALIGMHVAQRSVSSNSNTFLSGSQACYNIYITKDNKFVSIAAVEGKFWNAFCNAIKKEDLLDMQFSSNPHVIKHMINIFKGKTLKEWIDLNGKYDFCCEPVKNLNEVFNDQNFKSRKTIIRLDNLKQVAMPVLFSSVKKLNYKKAPRLGQHTSDILETLGYNKKQIDDLKKDMVIL
ncbi:MAG: CaiB/BaiF CoA-transferase family protein [Nanoarchaeota archaeon]